MSWKDTLKRLWRNRNEPADLHQERADRNRERPRVRRTADVKCGSSRPPTTSKEKRSGNAQRVDIRPLEFDEARYQDWSKTQFEGVDARSDRIQMVVGLDFGTSYTKVVLGENRVKYAVPMQRTGPASNRYLMPAVLHVSDRGECRIGGVGSGKTFNDLKMRILLRDFSTETQVLIAAYLALVMRHSRGWLMNEKRTTYEGTWFDWSVNVGLPTANALDDELHDVYRDIVHAAWLLSGTEGSITLALAEEALTEPSSGNAEEGEHNRWAWIHPEAVAGFQELTAEMASYVLSPRMSPGLHAIVDIGAGTLDVSVFNIVMNDGEPSYHLFARQVHRLGTEFLVRERLSRTGSNVDWPLSPQDPVPARGEMAKMLGVTLGQLKEVDANLGFDVRHAVSEEFISAKRDRFPKPQVWKDGVSVFVCGGGARCDFYNEALNLFFADRQAWWAKPEELPRPEALEAPDLHGSGVARLGVAYGLAMDPFDLGSVVNVEDDGGLGAATRRDWRGAYIDKDQT